jgi:anti-sigma B factor antagonist
MLQSGFPVEMVSDVPVVSAPAEIDITNADDLRAALLEAAGRDTTYVVDMSRTRFCDSAGLHALVDAYRQAKGQGGQVVLAVSGPAVLRVLELTGADQVLRVFPGVTEAFAFLAAADAAERP